MKSATTMSRSGPVMRRAAGMAASVSASRRRRVAAHSAGAARSAASSSAVAQPAASEEASASKLIFSSLSGQWWGASVAMRDSGRMAGAIGLAVDSPIRGHPEPRGGQTNAFILSAPDRPAVVRRTPRSYCAWFLSWIRRRPAASHAFMPPSRWATSV